MTKQEIDALNQLSKIIPILQKMVNKSTSKVQLDDNEELITANELAALTKTSRHRLTPERQKQFPHVMIGKRRKFLKHKCLEMLAEQYCVI